MKSITTIDHPQASVTVRKNLEMLDVFYVMEKIPQVTRDVQSTKSYKKAYPHFE
jgi:hypothetical protein